MGADVERDRVRQQKGILREKGRNVLARNSTERRKEEGKIEHG
jgi:hypothetical protein